MTYKDILQDQEILDIYDEIDKNNTSTIYHGKNHVLNVLDNLDKLNNLLNIEKHDLELLKIAITLHDIGHSYGEKEHYKKSEELARKYLKNKINNHDLEKILSAIKKHHEKENIKDLSIFEHLLLFSDKMDFTYKRLNPNHKTREYLLESDILDINFNLENDNFIVNIKTTNIDTDKLKFWPYYSKITKSIDEFADKINKKSKKKITF